MISQHGGDFPHFAVKVLIVLRFLEQKLFKYWIVRASFISWHLSPPGLTPLNNIVSRNLKDIVYHEL